MNDKNGLIQSTWVWSNWVGELGKFGGDYVAWNAESLSIYAASFGSFLLKVVQHCSCGCPRVAREDQGLWPWCIRLRRCRNLCGNLVVLMQLNGLKHDEKWWNKMNIHEVIRIHHHSPTLCGDRAIRSWGSRPRLSSWRPAPMAHRLYVAWCHHRVQRSCSRSWHDFPNKMFFFPSSRLSEHEKSKDMPTGIYLMLSPQSGDTIFKHILSNP